MTNSIGAKLVCIDNRFTLPTKLFTGSNSMKEFIQWVFEQQKYCSKVINEPNKKQIMSTENKNDYQNSKICWICSQK